MPRGVEELGMYVMKTPVYDPGEEGEAQAWALLALACRQCAWLR